MSKMGCAPIANLVQRAEEISGETEERPGQEEHHSARNLNVPSIAAPPPPEIPARERVNWPAMNDQRWRVFQEDSIKTLEVVLKGSISERLETLPTILHTIGKEMFGVKKQGKRRINEVECNRREVKIKN